MDDSARQEAAVPKTPSLSPASQSPVRQTRFATDDWVGEWSGADGMAIKIRRAAAPGRYRLKIEWYDYEPQEPQLRSREFTGTSTGDTIQFTRDGRLETIRAARRYDVGLKYLLGPDCLMIAYGEGWCRGDPAAEPEDYPTFDPDAPAEERRIQIEAFEREVRLHQQSRRANHNSSEPGEAQDAASSEDARQAEDVEIAN